MGMDVYGKKSTSKEGEYFRRNVWGWHPLAEICLDLAPDECKDCVHWHSNDGDGLDADGANKLADKLQQLTENGQIKEYIRVRNEAMGAMPDEECRFCRGTGVRTDDVGKAAGMPTKTIIEEGHRRHGQVGWCNGCNGRGFNRPFATYYGLDEQDVAEWIVFLRESGGFKIC